MEPRSIVFVYNADSGVWNALLDLAHKVVSPRTYDCNLCGLTYSSLGMRREWRRFVAGLGLPATFLHRDELHEKHDLADVTLPAVFLEIDSHLHELVSASELNSCGYLTSLMTLVQARLADVPQATEPRIRPATG